MRKQNNALLFLGILLLIWGILYDFIALNLFGIFLAIVGFRGKELEDAKNTFLAKHLKELKEKGQKTEEKEEDKKPKMDEPLFNFEDNG